MHTGLTEEGIDSLTVRDGRVGCIAVVRKHAAKGIFRKLRLHRLVPQNLAGLAIDADQISLQILQLAARVLIVLGIARPTSDEHLVAHDDRRGGARSRHVQLPGNIFIRAPGRGNGFGVGRDAGAVGPAKTSPVGHCAWRGGKDQPRRQKQRAIQGECNTIHRAYF